VQRGWLALEAVFAAPDIQRQVPGEAAAFAQVDRTYKDIMRRTHDRPHALQVRVYAASIGSVRWGLFELQSLLACRTMC
jgi:dynein heavy chain